MRLICLSIVSGVALLVAAGVAQQASSEGPYHVLKTAKVGGDGGFDYVYADSDGRKLYIARGGQTARITAFNLDTLESAGEIPNTNARGVAVDAKSHHGFASSKPVAMWDTNTMALIKTIDVDGRPDGILDDPADQRIYVFSHSAPNVTVIDAKEGKVLGTIDLGGAPEQAASDGKGRLYVDLEDKNSVAVVDTKAMKLVTSYGLDGKGEGPAGMGFDAKNHRLYVCCHDPQTMVVLDSNTGKVLGSVPIGRGTDGGGFNPKTMEAFSSQGDGTLTVVKEDGHGGFMVEQNVKTMVGAKTMTIDTKTNHILLIAAEYQAPAAGAPTGGGGRPRRTMIPGSFSIVVVGK